MPNNLYGPNDNFDSGEELSIKELAMLIKDVVGFKGNLSFNTEYPD